MQPFGKVAALTLFLTAPLGAQENWSALVSPTSQTLWGVAYGAGRWVAVGEQGTIITSPDGLTWSKQDSGFPDRWLTAVAHANNLWIAIGGTAPTAENLGLILTSSDTVNWTPRVTTGPRLNNVAYGNGTFTAVSDSGRVFASRDGLSWEYVYYGNSHAGYLRGLAYGAPFFVATGQVGILSSYDGRYWTDSGIFAAGQIEGAAYGRKQFVLAGADGATFTSRDGLTWTQQPTTSGTTFRGAAYFNNQFIAVGNSPVAGRGVATSFDGSRWIDRPTDVEAGLILRSVAAGPDSAIAVGDKGVILRSPAAAIPPAIVAQPASVLEARGGHVAFFVVASGSSPLVHQWRKDGIALDGATSDMLYLPSVTPAHAGNYSCIVTNAAGAVASDAATLTVLDGNPAPDPVDPTFALDTTLSSAPRVAALQADGKILIGGAFQLFNQGQPQSGLARLNANGSLDITFGPGVLNFSGSVSTITVQPDGRILVGGSFSTIGGVARRSLARLNPDGTVDPTFVPASSLGTVRQVELTSTGRVLVVDGSTALVRLNSDGSTDATWAFRSLQIGAGSGTSINLVTCTVQRIALQPNGQIVAYATTPPIPPSVITDPFSPPPAPTSFSILQELGVDGTIGSRLYNSVANSPIDFRLIADGTIYIATNTGLSRSPSNGSLLSRGSISVSSLACVGAAPDGSAWLGGAFSLVRSRDSNFASASVPRNQLVHVNPDLSIDAFDPGLGLTNARGSAVAPQCLLALPDGRALVCGDFTQVNSLPRAQVARLNARSPSGHNAPVVVALDAEYREVRDGDSFTVTALIAGSAPLTVTASSPLYGQYPEIATLDGATGSVTFKLTASSLGAIRAANPLGASLSRLFYTRLLPVAPVIVAQPTAVQTNTGRALTLGITSTGTEPLSYQWFKNGSSIAGALVATYSVAQTNQNNAGDYRVSISNSAGTVMSAIIRVGVDETARVLNFSTRANAGRSDSPFIVGFAIQGPGRKRLLIRAVGPTLGRAPFNVPGTLTDPLLNVYDASGTLVFTNNDWYWPTDAAFIQTVGTNLGAFPLASFSSDSAGLVTLPPGSYTAAISGFPLNGIEPSGLALAEIYEADTTSARLVNLSSRSFVSADAGPMILGFVTSTTGTTAPKQFLIRGVGPGLGQFGVANSLADPTLTIFDAAGKAVASNDDWEQSQNLADLRAATTVLTFPLAAGSKDSALLVALAPGQYTALVSGAGNASGTALVEIYEIP